MRRESISSLAVAAFGGLLLVYNLAYPLETRSNPGPGVFPLLVGAVLVVFAGRQLAGDLLGRGEGTTIPRTKGAEARVALMIAIMIVYLVAVSWLGFFASTFLFVMAASRLMGAKAWGSPFLLSAGINLFCYLLFETWLKLSFPKGYLF